MRIILNKDTPGGYITVVYDLTDKFLFMYYILLLCIYIIIYIRYYCFYIKIIYVDIYTVVCV